MSDNTSETKPTAQDNNEQVETTFERPDADIKKVLKPEVLNI
jgi:hypothetical protein